MDGWNGAERVTQYRALDRRVLAVATTRVDGWCAYIRDTPGQSHEAEWGQVLVNGSKLPESVARAVFPNFPPEGCPYAR